MKGEKERRSPADEARDNGYDVRYAADDWILSEIHEGSFYNYKFWADSAKSRMKPLVRKYSLARELAVKAAEIAIGAFVFDNDSLDQKKRIECVLRKLLGESIDESYEKEHLGTGDVRFSREEFKKFQRQGRMRLFNFIDRQENEPYRDFDDDDWVERIVIRCQAFDSAYLCLRSDDPEETFYILWGLIDMYDEIMRPMREAYERSRGQ